jgi:NAD/NADP transhydrogenase alpha subunit
MKKMILLALVSTFAFSGFFNTEADVEKQKKEEAARLCKVFTMKAETYKKSMRNDEYAKKTLATYIAKEQKFCSASKS